MTRNNADFLSAMGISRHEQSQMETAALRGIVDDKAEGKSLQEKCIDCGADYNEPCKRGCINQAEEPLEEQPACEECGAGEGKPCKTGCVNESLHG